MGLVQRKIEAAGIPTISLSNIPDFNEAVYSPRVAGIDTPQGRTVWQPNDAEGQMRVLRATLDALVSIDKPGTTVTLPFKWPESPKRARSHPKTPPPIAQLCKRKPWMLLRLISGDIPKS